MPKPGFAWSKLALWSLLVVLAAISIRQAVLLSARQKQVARLESENQRLDREVGRLTRAAAQPPAAPPPAPAPQVVRVAPHDSQSSALAAEQQIERMRQSLAVAHAEVAKLESRIAGLQSQVESLTADNRRLTTAGEDLNRNVTEANQTIETVRAELKANAARAAQMESANTRLEAESAAGKQSAVQLRQLAVDLEGIFRRREMYLNNILRRYKEVTEEYRALSGVRDSRRDRDAAPSSSAELSRIQNSIALAEEDLKQIQALSAQASRLQKKLPQK